MRQRIVVIAVAAVILVAGGLWARAQVQPPTIAPTPTVFSGADVGFRVERWDGDTPIGRWVVRSKGQWVEPRTTMGPRRLTSH